MVIKRVLRFVFRDKSSSHEELCKRIGPSSLREQRLAKILSIVFNILASDAGPESLSDLIAARRSTYNFGGTTDNTGPSKVKSTTFGWDHGDTLHWMLYQTSLRRFKHTLLAFFFFRTCFYFMFRFVLLFFFLAVISNWEAFKYFQRPTASIIKKAYNAVD